MSKVREEGLAELHKQIMACRICLGLPSKSRPLVLGSVNAKIILVSQAPARLQSNISSELWRLPSGDRLREWLGVTEKEFYNPNNFYITALGKCYPGRQKGSDLPPPKICYISNNNERGGWLEKELKLLCPKLVIALGVRALRYFALRVESLTACMRRDLVWNKTRLLVLPHPSGQTIAWRTRNRELFDETLMKLQKIVKSLINSP